MQQVLVSVSSEGGQEENERDPPTELVAESPQRNGHAKMPQRYQSYGQPTNVVVWSRKHLGRKKQVPDGGDPVCEHDYEGDRP
jgi:hypothetical protein